MYTYIPVSKPTLEITSGSVNNQKQKELFGYLLPKWQ